MQISVAAILVATVFLASSAKADKLPLPTAAYSADVTFVANGHESIGHINVDGPKERRELRGRSGTQIEIIRRDQGKVYDLRPQKHLAIAMRMAAAEAAGKTGAPGTDVDSFYGADVEADGPETVNGLQTTKYNVKIEAGPELTVKATVWATDDGIIVRVVGKTSVDGDGPPARMELKNIQPGPQEATLFEVPSGMTVLSPNADLPEPGSN